MGDWVIVRCSPVSTKNQEGRVSAVENSINLVNIEDLDELVKFNDVRKPEDTERS